MKYRHMGKTGKRVSALGFGCMRLPVLDGDNTKIDKRQAGEMVEYAIDNGVNYFDTAYVYHGDWSGQGQSEFFIGEALKPHRDNVYIATKLPSWAVKTHDDFDKFLDRQLKALQTDTIDFYLLHSLNQNLYDTLKKLEYKKFVEQAKKSGKIKHIGFSFHDKFTAFEHIINDYDWEFCQIQYNILDRDFQAGEKGLQLAKEKGIGLVVMEPLRGGKIIDVVKPAKDILSAYD